MVTMDPIVFGFILFSVAGLVGYVGRWATTRELVEIRDEDGDNSVYLRRWILIGRRSSAGGKDHRALMLHRIMRPDADRCHHDHPWGFWTLILSSGYVEEVTHHDHANPSCPRGGSHWTPDRDYSREPCTCPKRVNWMRPGTLAFRPATYTHRIASLPNGPALTLVLRTPYVRQWGFHTPKGWVYFRDAAGKLVEWCRS
jgi:hypothetical protein